MGNIPFAVLSKVVDLKTMGVPDGVIGTIGSIEGCPPIASGPGRVVPTTVNHLNNYVFNLTLTDASGADDTIGITGYRKVYSESRGLTDAKDLQEGELVSTASGVATVTGIMGIAKGTAMQRAMQRGRALIFVYTGDFGNRKWHRFDCYAGLVQEGKRGHQSIFIYFRSLTEGRDFSY